MLIQRGLQIILVPVLVVELGIRDSLECSRGVDGIGDSWRKVGSHQRELIAIDESGACEVHRYRKVVGQVLSRELEHDVGCCRVGLYIRVLTFVECRKLET
jgi:hypothetical protein